jgi:FkbM family methyltransferase
MANVLFLRRLEPGFWWIAWNDVIRNEVLNGTFEAAERKFLERFLQPGMTVLDIGAYYGLYTLTASVCVGEKGHVIAFEPSPFQRKRLQWHLRVNRCQNVRVENFALGMVESQQTLFSVPGECAGYSGLRSPEVGAKIEPIPVQVKTLDTYLRGSQISAVDLIKIDVEGGELDVFRGAAELLGQRSRPLILCELEDIRTAAWGHKARDTATFVEGFGYRWFRTTPDGGLAPWDGSTPGDERNFVAIPPERMTQVEETTRNEAGS